ncbi:MAG TPA: hypothetical protein VNT99_00045 [Methylomirabilota bacterium]|nr:hypothetical protein [Methylomirabilota bacterium]
MKTLTLSSILLCAIMANVNAAILLSDNFTYADGVLTNVSSGKWRHTSGGADQVNVVSEQVELTRSETEDVAASLATAYSASSPAVLYVKFNVTVSTLPLGANGNYFAHLDGGSARARIFVTTNAALPGFPGAAPGKFRFGIANATTAATGVWLSDLNLSETYTVVARLSVNTGTAELLVNPTSENDLAVPAGDGASAASVNSFAWRQDTGMGTLTVDNLVVATSFTEALLGNETPSISDIAEQRGVESKPTGAIPFSIGDAETAAEALDVFASASNNALVQSISFGGSGSNRSLTITPQNGQTGAVTITVFVTDGTTTNSDSFLLNILPALVFAEDFNYPDGALITNASPPWVHHSGSITGQIQIAGSQLVLSSLQTEDVSVPLTGGPFATNGGVMLYASFRVNFSTLPGSSGDYFAHFNTTGARCRLFANTANAAAQRFRLGIANGANAVSEQVAADLTLNTSYLVVLRYDPANALSTLWIDPSSENDAGANATDPISASAISAFAFREDPGIGTFTVDELRIGLSFSSVTGSAPASPVLRIERLADAVRIAWPITANGFSLQSNTNLNATNWENVATAPVAIGDENVVTNAADGNAFFRLKN